MKKFISVFTVLIIIFSLSACSSNANASESNIIASFNINDQLIMNIVLNGKNSSTEKLVFTGSIDAVVIGADFKELSKISLNEIFGKDSLTIKQNTSVSEDNYHDYNLDSNPDVAIGFPAEDGSDEYKYAVLSIAQDGAISKLDTKGYKDSGFIYSINCGNFPSFKDFNGDEVGIAIGVQENGVFVPAFYTWSGSEFIFEKKAPFVINKKTSPQNYTVSIEQTEFEQPMMPGDKDFTIYKSYVLGKFDIVITGANGDEKSRLGLNSLFGNESIGWAGAFPIEFEDYNNDGDYEFAIPQITPNSADFKYALISIDSKGIPYALEAKGYKDAPYVYDSRDRGLFTKLAKPLLGFSVVLSDDGWAEGRYIWQNDSFVITKQ